MNSSCNSYKIINDGSHSNSQESGDSSGSNSERIVDDPSQLPPETNGHSPEVKSDVSIDALSPVPPTLADKTTILFVGNLSFFCEESHLMELFSQYGHVQGIRILLNRKQNKSLMYGFVTMQSTVEAVEMVFLLDGHLFMGRKLKVALSDGSTEQFQNSASTLGNGTGFQVHVSFRSNFDDRNGEILKPTEVWLRKVFIGRGRLLDVTIKVYNVHEGKSSQEGYGFLTFYKQEDASKLCEVGQGFTVDGITVTCSLTHTTSTSSGTSVAGSSASSTTGSNRRGGGGSVEKPMKYSRANIDNSNGHTYQGPDQSQFKHSRERPSSSFSINRSGTNSGRGGPTMSSTSSNSSFDHHHPTFRSQHTAARGNPTQNYHQGGHRNGFHHNGPSQPRPGSLGPAYGTGSYAPSGALPGTPYGTQVTMHYQAYPPTQAGNQHMEHIHTGNYLSSPQQGNLNSQSVTPTVHNSNQQNIHTYPYPPFPPQTITYQHTLAASTGLSNDASSVAASMRYFSSGNNAGPHAVPSHQPNTENMSHQQQR